MDRPVRKVFAYITARRSLLVFRQPHAPEAGIQVPAGTVEANEAVEEAVLREAFEETGLCNLTLSSFLGEQQRDMSDFERDEIHQRFFFHLEYSGTFVPDWQHEELYHSGPVPSMPTLFAFFWAPLPDGVPPLIADHGIMLPQLLRAQPSSENGVQIGEKDQ